MKINTVNILLKLYFEGKTTLIEEQKLKTYFRSNNVDASLSKYKVFFKLLENDRKIRMQNAIKTDKPSIKLNKFKVAISIILFIGISFVSRNEYNNYQMRRQLTTIKKALYKVGSNLNKANIAIIELNKINKVITKK